MLLNIRVFHEIYLLRDCLWLQFRRSCSEDLDQSGACNQPGDAEDLFELKDSFRHFLIALLNLGALLPIVDVIVAQQLLQNVQLLLGLSLGWSIDQEPLLFEQLKVLVLMMRLLELCSTLVFIVIGRKIKGNCEMSFGHDVSLKVGVHHLGELRLVSLN